VLACSLAVTACSSGGGSSPAPSGSAAAPALPQKRVAALFPAEKPALADFAAASLLPKDVPIALVAPSLTAVLDDLGLGSTDEGSKAALFAALAEESVDLSKDLPPASDLASFGIAVDKPCGVAWFDPSLDTLAFFATVGDEAALKARLETLRDKSHGRRVLDTVGDALVLRAKKNVTRAVVLRKGVAFWVRSREDYKSKGDEVPSAVKALTAESDADSLAKDATFRASVDALHFGRHAGAYVTTKSLLDGTLADVKRRVASVERDLKSAEEALAAAKKKSAKPADVSDLEKRVTFAEANRQRNAEILARLEARNGLLSGTLPGVALGVSIDTAAVKVKAFAPLAKDAPLRALGPVSAKARARAWPASVAMAGRASVDPKYVPALLERVLGEWVEARMMSRAEGTAFAFEKDIAPLLSGDVEVVWHKPADKDAAASPSGSPSASSDPAASAPSAAAIPSASASSDPAAAAPSASATAAPSASASATSTAGTSGRRAKGEEGRMGGRAHDDELGFTIVLGVTDPAKARALLDQTLAQPAARTALEKADLKREPGSPIVEIANVPSYGRSLFLALQGDTFVLSTSREGLALAEGTTNAPPRALPPLVAELFSTSDAQAAFWGGTELFLRAGDLEGSSRRYGVLGALGSMDSSLAFLMLGSSKKTEKLRKELDKVQDEIRTHEADQRSAKQKAARDLMPALGEVAFVLAPEAGGLALYGGDYPAEASVKALVARAVSAWMSVGPASEEGKALALLRRKKQALTDKIKEESDSAMGDLLGGLGSSLDRDRPWGMGLGGSDVPWGSDGLGGIGVSGGTGGLGKAGTGSGTTSVGGSGGRGRGTGGVTPGGTGTNGPPKPR